MAKGPARDVLLVEDSDDIREALTELLALHGHAVRAVAAGLPGVAAAQAQPPEVMIVDVGLPDIDGHEVARRVRATVGPGPLLVAMTGYARDDDRRLALEAGFDLHLGKPVDVEALERLVARGRVSG